MSKIAIVGPGAIGSVLAAILHEAQRHELVLCARRAIPMLDVQTARAHVRFAPRVLVDPAQGSPVDWAFVTTKAYDAAGAAAWLGSLCGPATRVAVIQNGVEHRARFAGRVPDDRLVPVMIDCPAERNEGRVVQRGEAKIVVADDANGREFAALFAGTIAVVSVTPDLKSALWRKLCTNAAGVISGLVNQPSGVMHHAETAALARSIVGECVAVARAEGATLPDDVAEAVIAGYRSAARDGINSLHADLMAGRPTEIDARNGVIVRLGRKHGIATPYNDMAVKLVTLLMSNPAAARSA